MAHSRIIDCSWDEDTKVATVTRSSKWGVFTSTASPDEEDMPYANKWIGWEIADYKNRMLITAERTKAMKERMNGVNDVMRALGGLSAKYAAWSYDVIMDTTQREAVRRYRDEQRRYKNMKANFHKFCEMQISTRKEMDKKRNQDK